LIRLLWLGFLIVVVGFLVMDVSFFGFLREGALLLACL
jgi:hypothetical protein